eukprot:CAMPEP_0184298730 /NCGR_PEP_ID=MMETSP1049-20130417/9479_1 /TAXON_ID=77928 /ORGANISM="Proteomonas sulcata, Strain CCMP704" /LENGTH=335 /DNA_ID=CAMNT_0026608947 /DNA_START=418 /DNA_END=1425 /DNA_ORIENTATION=+
MHSVLESKKAAQASTDLNLSSASIPVSVTENGGVKNCYVKPFRCENVPSHNWRKRKQNYFQSSQDCDWAQALDQCFSDRELNWNVLSQRKYFLMGNSVTRHYAFALRDLLRGVGRKSISRQREKQTCNGVHGTASCGFDFATRTGHRTSIQFFWKNYIGTTTSHDDQVRDVCKNQARTERCLSSVFRGANKQDVLLVGSIPVNTTYFQAMRGNSLRGFHESGPEWLESQLHMNGHEIIRMLLSAFPGTIIWHSFPFLNNAKNQRTPSTIAFGDVNRCFEYGNSVLKCLTEDYDRVSFVNLQPLQARRIAEYQDFIHHSGGLSNDIVRGMVSILQG